MRGVGGAAAVGTATPPKRSTLPFNPVKGSDGTWTLKPTEEEKVLDEERARVSKLPRYVVAGNNVHGEPRYGVKIKIPGQRGQVRVGSAFKTIESAQNAARIFRNYASVDPHSTDLLLAPDAFKYGRCECEYYVNRATEATKVPAITIIVDILKKRNARHRAIAARAKGLGPEEVTKYAAEALATVTDAQERDKSDRGSPPRALLDQGEGGGGAAAAATTAGGARSAKRLRSSQGQRNSAESAAAAIANMAGGGFTSGGFNGAASRRRVSGSSVGSALAPRANASALDVDGPLYPSLPDVDAPAVGPTRVYGDNAGHIAQTEILKVDMIRGGGGGDDASSAWRDAYPETVSFGVGAAAASANALATAAAQGTPFISSMEPKSVDLHSSCMVEARGSNFCPSTTVFAVLRSDIIDGEQRCEALESRTTVDCKKVYFSAHGVELGAYCIFMSNDSEGISNQVVFNVISPGASSPLDNTAETLGECRLGPEVHAAVASVPVGGFRALRWTTGGDDVDAVAVESPLESCASTGTTSGSPGDGGSSTWSGVGSGSGMES